MPNKDAFEGKSRNYCNKKMKYSIEADDLRHTPLNPISSLPTTNPLSAVNQWMNYDGARGTALATPCLLNIWYIQVYNYPEEMSFKSRRHFFLYLICIPLPYPIINWYTTQFETECRCGGHSVTKKFKTILQIVLAKPQLWKNLYFYK